MGTRGAGSLAVQLCSIQIYGSCVWLASLECIQVGFSCFSCILWVAPHMHVHWLLFTQPESSLLIYITVS
jgi:hypothetical protein